MTNSKAPWLTRGGAIALMAAAGIALAACSGGGGLNEDEAAGLQQQLEDAQADAAAALAAQQLEEAARIAAEAAQALAVAEKLKAETEKTAAETARDAAVAQAVAAEKSAAAAAASAQEAADALAVALAAQQEAEDAKDAAEAAQQDAEDAAAEADRLRRLAVAAADTEEQRRQQAEADRDRSDQDAEDARQLVNEAQARAALAGLGYGSGDTRMGQDDHASPAVGLTATNPVTPRYRDTTLVNTDPAVSFSSSRRSSSGRWSITTRSKAGDTHDDELVVYTDLGGPTRVPIRNKHGTSFGTGDEARDGYFGETITTEDAELIASSRFPREGVTMEFENNYENDATVMGLDIVRFSGSYDGASGYFECDESPTCSVQRLGNRYLVSGGTWTFYTRDTATVSQDDDSYMYFGWWRRMEHEHQSFSFATFSGGVNPATGNATGFNDIVGSATYEGPAVGQYAIHQPADSDSGTGSFTASARLEADFDSNMLSGQVTNFSNASNWSLSLNQALMQGGSVANDAGTVDWTIAGNTEGGGMWDAVFYSESEYVGQVPEGVAGEFDAEFGSVGRLVGAFGAHKR